MRLFYISFLLLTLSVPFKIHAQTDINEHKKAKDEYKLAYETLKNREFDKLDSLIFTFIETGKILQRYNDHETFINSLCGLVECYSRKKDILKTSATADKILQYGKKHFSSPNKYSGNAFNYLGLAYYNNSKYDSAMFYFKKGLKERSKIWKDNNSEIAWSYNSIGLVYETINEFDSSLFYYKKALEIRKKIPNLKKQDLAVSYENLGNLYNKKREFEKSIYHHLKSLKIKEEIYEDNHSEIINGYHNIAITYYYMNQFNECLSYLKKSLHSRIKKYGINHIDVALGYENIGNVFLEINEHDSALYYSLKSLEIRNNLLNKDDISFLYIYNSLGVIYRGKGNFEKSLELFFKIVEISEKNHSEFDLNKAVFYQNIGSLYLDMRQFNLAIEYINKALYIISKNNISNNNIESDCYNNLGLIYEGLNKYDTSIKYFYKAININKKIYKENSFQIAYVYNNLGITYKSKEVYDSAMIYFLRAKEIFTNIYPENNYSISAVNNNIGTIYSEKKDYENALKSTFKSLSSVKINFGEKHAETASIYNNVAQIYYSMKEYDKALRYYQKGIFSSVNADFDSLDISLIPDLKEINNWHILLQASHNKALILSDSSNPKRNLDLAVQNFIMCDQLISITRKNILNEKDKYELAVISDQIYSDAIKVNLNYYYSGSLNKKENKKYVENALYFSEKNKLSVLLESIESANAKNIAGVPDTLITKEKQIKKEISYLNKRISEEKDISKRDKFSNLLFEANRKIDSLIIIYEKEYSKYYDLKFNNHLPDLKDLQNLIDRKSSIISYYTQDSTIYIFIIKRNDLLVYKAEKPNTFEESIIILRENISNPNILEKDLRNKTNESVEKYKNAAFELYETLFPKDLLNDENIKNLIIIPDGKLIKLPFEALLTADYKAQWTNWQNHSYFSNMPFLIKKYNIKYNYSANLLYTLNKNKRKSKSGDFLAMAPIFNNNNQLTNTDLSKNYMNSKTFLSDGTYISPLPASLSETQTIYELFKRKTKNPILKTYLKANEEFIKKEDLSGFKYIHFATHGIVNEDRPELSSLILAQDSSITEDNILYAGEIYNLELNSDLTVLSACETGLGKIVKGEGLIGLTRAFLFAGSKNIIVSLWQVADESTKDLMIEFYSILFKNNEKKRYDTYLRQSKLKLINNGKFAHPFFWAPFIIIGE